MATNIIKSDAENMNELVNIKHLVKLLPNDDDNRTNFSYYFNSLENPFKKVNIEIKCKNCMSEK